MIKILERFSEDDADFLHAHPWSVHTCGSKEKE